MARTFTDFEGVCSSQAHLGLLVFVTPQETHTAFQIKPQLSSPDWEHFFSNHINPESKEEHSIFSGL